MKHIIRFAPNTNRYRYYDYADRCIHKANGDVVSDHNYIKQTGKILECLVRNKGHTLSRSFLLSELDPTLQVEMTERRIDANINGIRNCLGPLFDTNEIIQTDYGFGYRYVGPCDEFIAEEEKSIIVAPEVYFYYGEKPYLYRSRTAERVILKPDECSALVHLIKNLGCSVDLTAPEMHQTPDEWDLWYARETGDAVEYSDNPAITLMEKVNRIGGGSIVLNLDRTMVFHSDVCPRVTPNALFEIIRDNSDHSNIFNDSRSFFHVFLPTIFEKTFDERIYNRDYLLESETGKKLESLFLRHNDSIYHINTQCKKLIEQKKVNVKETMKQFLERFGNLPLEKDSSWCPSWNSCYLKPFDNISGFYEKQKIGAEVLEWQLRWLIGFSFIGVKINHILRGEQKSLEIDPINFGGEHHISMMSSGYSLFYHDKESFTAFVESFGSLNSIGAIEKTSLRKNFDFDYNFKIIGKLKNIIQTEGKCLDLGMEEAYLFQENMVLLSGPFVVEGLMVKGKYITDFQNDYFDVLDSVNAEGTLCFRAKSSAVGVSFKAGIDKLKIRVNHIIDTLVNTNRTLFLSVIASIICVTDDDSLILKPIIATIYQPDSQKQIINKLMNKFLAE